LTREWLSAAKDGVSNRHKSKEAGPLMNIPQFIDHSRHLLLVVIMAIVVNGIVDVEVFNNDADEAVPSG
jgi:hypothetical protein